MVRYSLESKLSLKNRFQRSILTIYPRSNRQSFIASFIENQDHVQNLKRSIGITMNKILDKNTMYQSNVLTIVLRICVFGSTTVHWR